MDELADEIVQSLADRVWDWLTGLLISSSYNEMNFKPSVRFLFTNHTMMVIMFIIFVMSVIIMTIFTVSFVIMVLQITCIIYRGRMKKQREIQLDLVLEPGINVDRKSVV